MTRISGSEIRIAEPGVNTPGVRPACAKAHRLLFNVVVISRVIFRYLAFVISTQHLKRKTCYRQRHIISFIPSAATARHSWSALLPAVAAVIYAGPAALSSLFIMLAFLGRSAAPQQAHWYNLYTTAAS